jgi:ribosomal protein S18 acetylase RimI-like enzyme
MINIREYELLTLETGAYRDIELDILKETLAAWKESPGKPYELIELRDGRVLAGFCLFYRSPNTEYTFDIHTFVVGRDYRNKAVGPRLLELLDDEIARRERYAVVRVETSRLKESAIGDSFFTLNDFQTIGHIPGFYELDNDYYIYVRSVSALARAAASDQSHSPESAPESSSAPD